MGGLLIVIAVVLTQGLVFPQGFLGVLFASFFPGFFLGVFNQRVDVVV
ncbi:MAG: hypothetical protein BWY72_01725 [Bacteroidetes bacterium ADurb.Bin416]|nr:MAG: hypothetical protein BWY72_01725 [Bacteroidetes bacterium ADurb.Bin416]